MRLTRILLVIVAVACFGVALSYPIRYYLAQRSNNDDMEQLSAMRSQAREAGEAAGDASAEGETDGPEETSGPVLTARAADGETGDDGVEPTEAGDAPGPTKAPDEAPNSTETSVPIEVSGEPEAPGDEAAASGADSGTSAVARREDGMPVRVTPATGEAGESADGVPDVLEAVGTSGAPATSEGTGNAAEISEPTPGPTAAPTATATPGPTAVPTATATPVPTPTPTLDPYYWDLLQYDEFLATPTPIPTAEPTLRPVAGSTAQPGPTRDPFLRTGALPYDMKEKVELDESAILPELKDIYALNHDLVGWITIPDTVIDYPVVQSREKDSEYYLTHDFYGEENVNGQIILDAPCDPYTPSYNLVISGHHMKNGSMFGNLPLYATQRYWEQHRFLEFDTLMERKQYVIFAAFYSADYDENEEGFRYNVDVRFKIDANLWLDEIHENQLYDTGIDVEFGDEFITLTTCNRARHRNGRFVVVARKIREGEIFE